VIRSRSDLLVIRVVKTHFKGLDNVIEEFPGSVPKWEITSRSGCGLSNWKIVTAHRVGL
jgi:hypothetical protein